MFGLVNGSLVLGGLVLVAVFGRTKYSYVDQDTWLAGMLPDGHVAPRKKGRYAVLQTC